MADCGCNFITVSNVNDGLLVFVGCARYQVNACLHRMRCSITTTSETSRDRLRTRGRILRSAQLAFARSGYAAASVRDIAADAGITAALVLRYFGSKEQLFAQAVAASFDLAEAFSDVERAALGRAFTDQLFSEQREGDLLAMMLRAAVDPMTHPVVRRLAEERMLAPMAALIGGEDARRRAALVLSLATGLWFYRFLLPLQPLAGDVAAAERARVAAILQRIVDDGV
ncbi:MAG: TetR family transcriptional regulator [Sphingomonas sp.]